MRILLVFILTVLLFADCSDPGNGTEPLDIIKGVRDLQCEYTFKTVENPTTIDGYVEDEDSGIGVTRVKVTLREHNTNVTYSTLTKEGGDFRICCDAMKAYTLYVEKAGYKKTYFKPNPPDSVFSISSGGYYTLYIER